MSHPTVTVTDLRTIEAVLDMGSGYVLDFSDRTFADFFDEHGIDINDSRYKKRGTSKAKRLRCFLRSTPPPESGQILAALLDYRQSGAEPERDEKTVERYLAIVERLGSSVPKDKDDPSHRPDAEAALLAHAFDPKVFRQLPGDSQVHAILIARMQEAQRCIEHESWLAAVILSGSVLEGMALGFGTAHPESVNRAYVRQYNKPAPRLWDWKLHEWITVLTKLRAFTPNIEKFAHAVRDFRNYVHPSEQLANQFSPDPYTARICFHVVQAAAKSLVDFEDKNAL